MAQSISVIIPTVGERTLKQTLLAIIPKLSELDEIIVIGTYSDELPSRFSNVKFVSTHNTINAASARNLGMKNAKGNIFLFTDSDCIPDKNWISGHRYYQTKNQQMVICKLLSLLIGVKLQKRLKYHHLKIIQLLLLH